MIVVSSEVARRLNPSTISYQTLGGISNERPPHYNKPLMLRIRGAIDATTWWKCNQQREPASPSKDLQLIDSFIRFKAMLK
jgi:hypothetical protein